jgi:hypothetical protein
MFQGSRVNSYYMNCAKIKLEEDTMKNRSFVYKYLFAFISCFLYLGHLTILPCTVAVVSGKATPDGRPLMWKNRDTSVLNNKIVFLKGEKYNFIGLIDAKDKNAINVWAGINTEGFAIMNSASGDLASEERSGMGNGRFMKLALEVCATASDFENLLKSTNGERGTAANFGVLDAEGNACIFETGSSSFRKYDANDPEVAPQGYIIRTNYAFTAPEKGRGGGYIRFDRALRLFQKASSERRLDYKFILQKVTRDLVNEKLHSFPLTQPKDHNPSSPLYINTNDTINRNSTASVALFHGVAERKKSHLATMWVILGQPICSVAIPLWATAEYAPEVLAGPKTAPLNDFSRALVSYLYPDPRGHMSQYLNVSRLIHYGGDGVLSRLHKIENQVFTKTEAALKEWEKEKPAQRVIADFEEKISEWIFKSLKNSFLDIQIIE